MPAGVRGPLRCTLWLEVENEGENKEGKILNLDRLFYFPNLSTIICKSIHP